MVQEPPVGAPVQLQITQNGQPYCVLTIPDGIATSNTVDGFALGPLPAKAAVGVNVTSVSQTPGNFPGRDLTVTIRL